MLSKHLAAAAFATALIATPAFAQAPKSADNAPAAQSASSSNLWQGSKFIGLNVYNNENDKIGDIKDMMLNKDGKVDLVVIGVGGFLGVGERDVAIKWSDMKWVNEPVRSSSSSSSSGNAKSTTGAANTSSSSTSSSSAPRTYPDHAVFNASKDQLKSMPQFDYNK
jgi:sporulation protein YlmC with PRC-barrel domain